MLITVTFTGSNQSFQTLLSLLVLSLCNALWKGSTTLRLSSFYQAPRYFLYSSFLYETTIKSLTYSIFHAPKKAKRSYLSPFPIFCCFPASLQADAISLMYPTLKVPWRNEINVRRKSYNCQEYWISLSNWSLLGIAVLSSWLHVFSYDI